MKAADGAQFDLFGELPQGTTVLEASAGTGKTFTIAGLVTRYVAEGVTRLDELLVVTFGRAATQELRDRVRERLVSARDGLVDPVAARASGGDDLVRHLASAADDEVAARRQRLVIALGSFDAATVATTHQFCQQVLIGLGTAGDADAGAVLVENLDDLMVEVVQDLYLRKWGLSGDLEVPPLTVTDALKLARAVVKDGQALLVHEGTAAQELPGLRGRFAVAVRAEVEHRKRQRRLLGFDDLLTRLRRTLADEHTGPAAAARLRARYRVVLVDEFQDTDPVQWDILRLAFHGAATLVLIGDPKQAIYAFRGADVQAYLAAAGVADRHATLAQNWRSDPDLLLGLDAVFRNAALGDPRIVVHPVSAAYSGRSLKGPGAPVRIRVVAQGDLKSLPVKQARDLVTHDLVQEIVAVLHRGTLLPRGASDERRVEPADIAVIVRTGAQLDLVHDALLTAGVPAVQHSTSSVFRTPAGTDWIVLLEALEQPHRIGRLRRLAISSFLGWDAVALETQDIDQLGLRLRHWVSVLGDRGIAALFETVSREQGLPSRMLAQRDGERRLTDLRHVGEALHGAAMDAQLGLTATLEWLRRRVKESDDDPTVERSRRLDSDAAAVQVLTVYASKGLEFPIVYVPFGWDRHIFEPDIPLFHEASGSRVRDVGGPTSSGFAAHKKRHKTEESGEDLRLLYVALTRAQSQVTAWWAPTDKNTPCAALHRLLLTEDPSAGVPQRVAVPSDSVALTRLSSRSLANCLSVAPVHQREEQDWHRAPAAPQQLSVAVLGRALDPSWRRTSYSALTSGVHDAGPAVGSENEVDAKDDEPATLAAALGGDARLRDELSPMHSLPGGAAFGTLVHSVLERVDPTSADLAAEVRRHVGAQLAWGGIAALAVEDVSDSLLPALRTPLGPLAGNRALADIAPGDRLAELDFELPLRGGDRSNGISHLRDLAELLRQHLPSTDPLASYAELLEDPVLGSASLKGYLAGSIDAVLRVDRRFVVVDYKTNRLGPPDAPLTAWSYRTEAMAEAMLHAHYPLQALLYEVALHRFLRWRLRRYRPEQHLGGVLYLFLRGMCGPGVIADDGSVPGVFAWKPPPALVVAISDLLATGLS